MTVADFLVLADVLGVPPVTFWTSFVRTATS
jgi:hypothetical protein